MGSTAQASTPRLRLLRALATPAYRRYLSGNVVSLVGVWMHRTAVGWLTWELTGSGAWLGLIAFADLFPSVVLSPLTGVLADRLSLRRIALVTQGLGAVLAMLLGIVALVGSLSIHGLIMLVLLQGIVTACWQPARLALVPALVQRDDLPSAVALNSLSFNAARFIGPLLAGWLISASGTGWVFVVNALSSVLFCAALATLEVSHRLVPGRTAVFDSIVAGYRYAAGHPGIGPLLLLVGVSCLGLRPINELLPGFAEAVFDRGAQGLAIMAAVTGLGAIVGGLWLGQRPSVSGLTAAVIASVGLFIIALIVFSLTDHFGIALVCLAFMGTAMVLSGAGLQVLLQTAVDASFRGRVMALYGMLIRGLPAVGALSIGLLSTRVGLEAALLPGAVLTVVMWLVILSRYRKIVSAVE